MNREDFIQFVQWVRCPNFICRLDRLHQMSQESFNQPHWIWNALVTSAATRQGIGNIAELHEIQNQWDWNAIAGIGNENHFVDQISNVLQHCGVRFPRRKAQELWLNRQKINDDGGPEAVHEALRNFPNVGDAIEYLRQFHGIGQKYARNIGMDAALPLFENSIALDSRLIKIAGNVAGAPVDNFNASNPQNYAALENWYIGIADDLNITPWHLDRTLFWLSNPLGLYVATN